MDEFLAGKLRETLQEVRLHREALESIVFKLRDIEEYCFNKQREIGVKE